MNKLQKIQRENLKSDVTSFSVGDTLRVEVLIVEGGKERPQSFTGTVIAKNGAGISETFTMRRVVSGLGLERIFPLHSPRLAKIEVLTRGKVRRSKLYYLRDRVGKAAKVKTKRF